MIALDKKRYAKEKSELEQSLITYTITNGGDKLREQLLVKALGKMEKDNMEE